MKETAEKNTKIKFCWQMILHQIVFWWWKVKPSSKSSFSLLWMGRVTRNMTRYMGSFLTRNPKKILKTRPDFFPQLARPLFSTERNWWIVKEKNNYFNNGWQN